MNASLILLVLNLLIASNFIINIASIKFADCIKFLKIKMNKK